MAEQNNTNLIKINNLFQYFRVHLWFPHILLFVATFILGLFELGPLVHHFLMNGVTFHQLISLSTTVFIDIVDGAPKIISGVFLLIMSIGLFLRSRLAWIICILVICLNIIEFILIRTSYSVSILIYEVVLFTALILARRDFQHSSVATASLFAFTSMFSLLGYAIVGAYILGAQFSPPIKDLGAAFYFAIVTMSTVGFGDIVPKTPETHLFVISIIILGITIFATSLSTLVVPLISKHVHGLIHPEGKIMEFKNHYVIISQSAMALNSSKELLKRGEKIVFIVESLPDHQDEQVTYIVGDPSNLDVLQRANSTAAKAILALSNDDSTNVFVILAAKELAGSAKTVTVVNDARNLARMKLVHPDIVISPAILGGELLAMALSGETLQTDDLIKKLLHTENS